MNKPILKPNTLQYLKDYHLFTVVDNWEIFMLGHKMILYHPKLIENNSIICNSNLARDIVWYANHYDTLLEQIKDLLNNKDDINLYNSKQGNYFKVLNIHTLEK